MKFSVAPREGIPEGSRSFTSDHHQGSWTAEPILDESSSATDDDPSPIMPQRSIRGVHYLEADDGA